MGEGFGFYDIRRWRMAPWFLNRVTVGTWVKKEVANAAGLTLYNPATGESDGVNGSLAEGNIFLFPKPKDGWKNIICIRFLQLKSFLTISLNRILAGDR